MPKIDVRNVDKYHYILWREETYKTILRMLKKKDGLGNLKLLIYNEKVKKDDYDNDIMDMRIFLIEAVEKQLKEFENRKNKLLIKD